MLGDFQIARMVLDAFSADSRIDKREVQFEVKDGVVHLRGAVDSAAESRAAEEDVYATGQVTSVVNGLTLRNYIERTDEELRQSVRRALRRDLAVEDDRIHVETADGVVTLSGSVCGHRGKAAAENVAWWTPGVTGVVSRIEIEGAASPPED